MKIKNQIEGLSEPLPSVQNKTISENTLNSIDENNSLPVQLRTETSSASTYTTEISPTANQDLINKQIGPINKEISPTANQDLINKQIVLKGNSLSSGKRESDVPVTVSSNVNPKRSHLVINDNEDPLVNKVLNVSGCSEKQDKPCHQALHVSKEFRTVLKMNLIPFYLKMEEELNKFMATFEY